MTAVAKTQIEENLLKKIIKSQQGELDAVLVYRKLAAKTTNKKEKQLFLTLAAEEGKHAAILKNITQATCTPKKFKSQFVSLFYSVFGLNRTLNILVKGELAAIPFYEEIMVQYPVVKTLRNDEEKHARMLETLRTK